MRVKPILFSGPMVRAILAGAKTQTRRVIKPQPQDCKTRLPMVEQVAEYCTGNPEQGQAYYCRIAGCWNSTEPFFPAHKPGDVRWVREPGRVVAYQHHSGPPHARIEVEYLSGSGVDHDWYNPRAWMPWPERFYHATWARNHQGIPNGVFREAARLFVKITAVRAERLASISERDVLAEGVTVNLCPGLSVCGCGSCDDECNCDADERDAFRKLWDTLAKPGMTWAHNPWVWVYEFERTAKPEGWPDA